VIDRPAGFAVTPNNRSRGVVAAIEGVFGFMWFGWGQADAPTWLRVPLWVGSGLGVLVVVAGIVLAARSTGQRTAMSDPAVRRRYNVIVGTEFAIITVGAVLLGRAGYGQWVTVWVCAVVGLHFLPLARVFAGLHLASLGVLVTVVAAAALVTGLGSAVVPTTVTGPGTGVCLLVAAIATLAGRTTLHAIATA
jgi:hypothetical protein